MSDENQDRSRFLELLDWHVNGTLSQTDQDWMAAYLQAHPEVQQDLHFTQAFQAQLRAAVVLPAADAGMDRLMARIQSETRATARLGWWDRLHSALGARQLRPSFTASWPIAPSFAIAAAVVVVQAGVIGALLTGQHGGHDLRSELGAIRSADFGQGADAAILQVSFKADTRESDLRMAIVGVSGTLIGGPGQLGNYVIVVRADAADSAIKALTANPFVEEVRRLSRPPAQD